MNSNKASRLTPIKRLPAPAGVHARWLCKCACGGTAIVRGNELGPTAPTKSCGCLQRQAVSKARRRHGMCGTRTYRIWAGVIQRCQNKNYHRFPDYGGRGITVCERWQTFQNFLADMGECPSNKHSINRIDNDGPYSPENCEWATLDQQILGKRSTITVTIDGKTWCLKDYCKKKRIGYSCVRYRLSTGMTLEEALNRPTQNRRMWRRRVK